MGLVHRVLVVGCALLLAVQVVRNAAVAAMVRDRPQSAAKVWPGHPEVRSTTAMVEIAAATGSGQPVPNGALRAMESGAATAPLLAEPYLVRGVQAQLAGDERLARAAFLAAERRAPRALPAHYFLAEQDLRSGNVAHGLAELSTLARLAPDGPARVAPFVAAFARDRRHWPQVRALFRSNPTIAAYALAKLAADPGNAATIMALTDRQLRAAGSSWLVPLLGNMIAAGNYGQARALWAVAADVRLDSAAPLFDAGFRNPGPPPPFNWELTSSTIGLAERRPGGRLHALFYGQQDGPLARQLLLLGPGRYRLAMRVAGDPARIGVLRWSASCAGSSAPLASADLASIARRPLEFAVPAGCPAVWLELGGVAGDIAQQADVTISDLSFALVGGNG